MLKDFQDAFGHEMLDAYRGKNHIEIIERSDGYFDATSVVSEYLDAYGDWPPVQRKALKYARGRVLDIGCGAGRHSLYLQQQGLDVLGIDLSPLAVEVCKKRGLQNVACLSITRLSARLGVFDTILMLGNNFGLLQNFDRAQSLLKRFRKMTSAQARIIAETRDPYATNTPEHLEYHRMNRAQGRMGGQVRIRVRYKRFTGPWFDYLLASREEMLAILEGTGWQVKCFITSADPAVYIAIIEKSKPSRLAKKPRK